MLCNATLSRSRRRVDVAQLATLQAEHEPAGAGRDELLDPATLREPRGVGRRQLPTTVIGLLVHIAEHTQRHIGQAISAAKLAGVSVE